MGACASQVNTVPKVLALRPNALQASTAKTMLQELQHLTAKPVTTAPLAQPRRILLHTSALLALTALQVAQLLRHVPKEHTLQVLARQLSLIANHAQQERSATQQVLAL